jgi:hypothetical protein
MNTNSDDRTVQTERLDTAMDRRRRQLRLRWKQVADRAGMTYSNLHRIRTGQITLTDFARDGVEDALQWEHGSVAAILDGAEPTERRQFRVTTEADVPKDLRLPEGLELRDDVEAAIWAITDLPKDARRGYIYLHRAGDWPPAVSGLSQTS